MARQILEAVVNPRIQMGSQWWDAVTQQFSMAQRPRNSNPPRSSSTLSTLANFPQWIRRPDLCIHEIAAVYLTMRDDATRMRQYLDHWPDPASTCFTDSLTVEHCRYQAGYTLVVTLALILNTLLRAFDPSNSVLTAEEYALCEDLIRESEVACRYRPLGAAYVSLCLVVGCSAAEDRQQLARLQALLIDYSTDFKEINWMERVMWLRTCFYGHHLRLRSNVAPSGGGLEEATCGEENGRPESCCIM